MDSSGLLPRPVTSQWPLGSMGLSLSSPAAPGTGNCQGPVLLRKRSQGLRTLAQGVALLLTACVLPPAPSQGRSLCCLPPGCPTRTLALAGLALATALPVPAGMRQPWGRCAVSRPLTVPSFLQECSLFYCRRFCLPCVQDNVSAFPQEIQQDLEKRKGPKRPSRQPCP